MSIRRTRILILLSFMVAVGGCADRTAQVMGSGITPHEVATAPLLSEWPDSSELINAGVPLSGDVRITVSSAFASDRRAFNADARLELAWVNIAEADLTATLIDNDDGGQLNSVTTAISGSRFIYFMPKPSIDTVITAQLSTLGHLCDITGKAEGHLKGGVRVEGLGVEFLSLWSQTATDAAPQITLPVCSPPPVEDECDDPFTDEIEECDPNGDPPGGGGVGGTFERDDWYTMTPTEDPDGVVLACYYTDWYLIHSDGGRQFIETQDIGCWLEMVDELP